MSKWVPIACLVIVGSTTGTVLALSFTSRFPEFAEESKKLAPIKLAYHVTGTIVSVVGDNDAIVLNAISHRDDPPNRPLLITTDSSTTIDGLEDAAQLAPGLQVTVKVASRAGPLLAKSIFIVQPDAAVNP